MNELVNSHLLQIAAGAAVPNLDTANTPAEFSELRDQLNAAQDAHQKIADAFAQLASYAGAKSNAASRRLAGNIESAQRFEAAAESVYNELPEWARR